MTLLTEEVYIRLLISVIIIKTRPKNYSKKVYIFIMYISPPTFLKGQKTENASIKEPRVKMEFILL